MQQVLGPHTLGRRHSAFLVEQSELHAARRVRLLTGAIEARGSPYRIRCAAVATQRELAIGAAGRSPTCVAAASVVVSRCGRIGWRGAPGLARVAVQVTGASVSLRAALLETLKQS